MKKFFITIIWLDTAWYLIKLFFHSNKSSMLPEQPSPPEQPKKNGLKLMQKQLVLKPTIFNSIMNLFVYYFIITFIDKNLTLKQFCKDSIMVCNFNRNQISYYFKVNIWSCSVFCIVVSHFFSWYEVRVYCLYQCAGLV